MTRQAPGRAETDPAARGVKPLMLAVPPIPDETLADADLESAEDELRNEHAEAMYWRRRGEC